MSILGNRVLRKEDPKFLTAGGTYVDDHRFEGFAHVTYVRSTMAHATISAVDVDEVRQSGTVGSTPAVQSAVIDGLSHLGVRHLDMPASPERVWQAIRAASA